MTYNKQNLPQYVETAGKITILTALTGVLLFAFIFLLNIGKTELAKVEAATGTATTSLTVLNTPPVFRTGFEGREQFESSTSTPTNSGDQIAWVAIADDANLANYYLIVCSGSATPTAQVTGAPVCSSGVLYAVSASTTSGTQARAATTTTEIDAESNVWYSWVCDNDPTNPRCSNAYSTGTAATNSSPYFVNHRPTFTSFSNNGPQNPGAGITFSSISSDTDVNTDDLLYLVVCKTASYSTTTNTCTSGTDFIASTTLLQATTTNTFATYTIPAITQDAAYTAFGFLYDQHGHDAFSTSSVPSSAQGTSSPFTVNNVAPTVTNISLNGGLNMNLTVEAGQTTGFPLSYTANDANSCDAVGGGNADEVTGYQIQVQRSGVATSTCTAAYALSNPASCYNSGVATTTWNLSCTASSTSCTAGGADNTVDFNCTFPIWFIADPTDGTSTDTNFFAEHWTAGVAAVDNNNATGSMSTSSTPVEMISYAAISLLTNQIAYTSIEPGTDMPTLIASTTVRSVGNTGMNQLLGGDSMCGAYSPTNPCAVSATSTIPTAKQKYATTSAAYGAASAFTLTGTSSPTLLDIRILKPTSTSTASTKQTFWGIGVPGTITLSGNYTGQNVFIGSRSAPATW